MSTQAKLNIFVKTMANYKNDLSERNKDQELIEENDDYHFSKEFICDVSKSLTRLEDVLSKIKCEKFYGDIIWPENIDKDKVSEKLKCEIEEQLKANNKEFTRFPSDLTHARFSRHVYEFNSFTEGGNLEWNEEWTIHKVFIREFSRSKY